MSLHSPARARVVIDEDADQAQKRIKSGVHLIEVRITGVDGTRATRFAPVLVRDSGLLTILVRWGGKANLEVLAFGARQRSPETGSRKRSLRKRGLSSDTRSTKDAVNAANVANMRDRFAFRFHQSADYGLTCRELEILDLMSDGMSKSMISDSLFISYHTVDMHVKHIYAKLDVHNCAGAVAKGIREYII